MNHPQWSKEKKSRGQLNIFHPTFFLGWVDYDHFLPTCWTLKNSSVYNFGFLVKHNRLNPVAPAFWLSADVNNSIYFLRFFVMRVRWDNWSSGWPWQSLSREKVTVERRHVPPRQVADPLINFPGSSFHICAPFSTSAVSLLPSVSSAQTGMEQSLYFHRPCPGKMSSTCPTSRVTGAQICAAFPTFLSLSTSARTLSPFYAHYF